MRKLWIALMLIFALLLANASAYDSSFAFSSGEMDRLLNWLTYSGDSMEEDIAVLEAAVGNDQAARQAISNLRKYGESTSSALEVVRAKYDRTNADGNETITYVLNRNTMKFHRPNCKYVNQIKDSNRLDYTGSREDVVAMGYSPCGGCRP